ncbi:MAG TPA: ATP-binding protein, partial [Rectinemataceae bacterium]|nr:ATP-binding protein [Rectinemataceae bacterium]
IHGRDIIQCNIRDISERMKAQGRDRLVRKILETLNSAEAESDTLHDILRSVQESLDVQAVGIRMQEGDDFPFYVTIGFEEGFLRDECLLCARDEAGDVLRDADGRAWLQCVCGSILQARTDPGLPFFTPGGSFWSNSISELPPSIARVDSPENMRNSCGRAGYESVALIPLRSKGEITGLLQLNDRRRDRFEVDVIDFLEGLGASIGIALLRKQTESELRFRNLILSTQQEASIDGILVVKDNRVISHNRRFAELFDIPDAATIPGSDERFWESVLAQVPDVEDFLKRVAEIDAKPHETSRDEMVLNKGTIIDRYSAPLLDAKRKVFGRVWYFRDVTETKRAESELRFRNLLLSTQQEASIDGILVVDVNGTIVSHNRHFVDMFGIPREVIDSKSDERTIQSVIDKIEDPDVFLARIDEINATFEASSQEEIALKSGTVFERYSAPLLDAKGGIFGRVWFFRDITARKQAEQVRSDLEAQLRGAQKMEAIGSLAGGVAHDFNNILSVILSNTGFVLKATPDGDPRRDDLLEVKKAAERAAGLTRQLLAFSRKQVLQPVPLDLNHVTTGLEKMLRRILGEDIDLVLALAPDIGLTRADPGQIEQVLMNLVVNARDAMPEGGKLTIETGKVDLDSEHAALHEGMEPGPYVMLAVSDSGSGMDEQTKARIFEPFFTTKERGKGTGLGLSTVYGIINQSGGSIWVYSELGHGTTFKIYFPLDSSAPVPAAIEKAEAIDSPHQAGKATILVVEDEDALRKVAQRSLDGAGYKVMTASNGEEALEIYRRYRGQIDLLLTDVVMPRMGGRLLANEFLKDSPTIKVIFMSGYTDDAIVHHGVLEAGTNFIGKPFTEEALFRKVEEVLGAAENRPIGSRGPIDPIDPIEGDATRPPLDKEALLSLPAGMLAKLRQAIVAARIDEMIELIENIRATSPELADQLRRMANDFDFQGLRDSLGR